MKHDWFQIVKRDWFWIVMAIVATVFAAEVLYLLILILMDMWRVIA